MTTPARYEGAKYEDVPKEIRELFEKMRQTRRGIYIHGDVGTGKTHIAYALRSKYFVPMGGRYALLWNTTELLREMRQDFDRPGYDKSRAEEYVMSHEGLVILDDVGSEKLSDWVAETFYLIINKRYNAMAPTIITSNLPIPDLGERIGDRTASRIVEMCDVVELIGADRRITEKPKIKINI